MGKKKKEKSEKLGEKIMKIAILTKRKEENNGKNVGRRE